MKRFYSIIFSLGLALLSQKSFANGGVGIEKDGAFGYAKLISPIAVPEARVKKETLRIQLDNTTTQVHVEYVLESQKDLTVDYYFPVKVNVGYPRDKAEERHAKKIPRKVSMKLDGQTLPVQEVWGTFAKSEDKQNPSFQWKSRLALKKGAQTLTVDYHLPNTVTASGTSKGPLDSYEANFCYGFAPAATWGNGQVEALKIEIDGSKVLPDITIHEEPGIDLGYESSPFWKEKLSAGPVFRGELRQVAFDKLPYLCINFPYAGKQTYQQILFGTRMLKPVRLQIVSAPAAKAGYPLASLTDRDFNTAYVPATLSQETNESSPHLVFSVVGKTSKNGLYCSLARGYLKSKEALAQNRRLKKIRVGEQEYPWREDRQEDPPWMKKLDSFSDNLFITFTVPTYKPGEKIGIYFLETLPGTHSEDLPLTELFCAECTPDEGTACFGG